MNAKWSASPLREGDDDKAAQAKRDERIKVRGLRVSDAVGVERSPCPLPFKRRGEKHLDG